MSKELINIISKDDLKILVAQGYQQRKIYSESTGILKSINLTKHKNRKYYFKGLVNLKKLNAFYISKMSRSHYVTDFSLDIRADIYFYNDEIDIDLACYDRQYGVSFCEEDIRRTPESTVEETTNAIIELIEEINNKQDLFKLVWSE